MRRFSHLAAVLALAGIGAMSLAADVQANTPIYGYSAMPSTTQAGAHPDIAFQFTLGTRFTEPPSPCFCNEIKNITADAPPGVIGVPARIPKCTAAEFATFTCPVDSQVGVVAVLVGGRLDTSVGIWGVAPLYNTEPHPDQSALLAFPAPLVGSPIYLSFTARTESDYGLEVETTGVPKLAPIYQFLQEIWGVPADPVHDQLRFPRGGYPGGTGGVGPTVLCQLGDPTPFVLESTFPTAVCGSGGPDALGGKLVSASVPAVPFTSSPTACTGPLTTTLDTLAHDYGTDHAEAPWPATTGCDQLTFNPSLSAKPTTTGAESPSGLDVDLKVPQPLSATTLSSSEIRTLKLTLPPGFTINPSAADGKLACADAQAHFGTREPAECPEQAKIGTLSIDSSVLPGPLPGALYLGQPLPGNRYRLFLTADDFSLHVKLAGVVTPDPATGQITTTFELPQTPFQEVNMHLFGAEKGLLATPEQCGTYAVQSEFTPWAYPYTPKQTSTQFFTIDSGPEGSSCPNGLRPFGPSFEAGVSDNTAAAHSHFTVQLTRPDGDQNLTGLTVKSPPGFTATLAGIPYCPESAIAQLQSASYSGLAEQAASACSAASYVGSVIAGAGAGSKPVYLNGKAYLAGPYKGAPLSLIAVVPAVSGPYDLRNVAVRVALYVDESSAQITAVSDPLPQIVGGIPLRTRFIRVSLDREGFALNPTNCDPFSVDATLSGDEGASARLSSHFQVANCADLSFGPKLSFRLTGSTKRGGNPSLLTTIRTGEGEANFMRAQVILPHSEFIDNAHLAGVCTRVQFAASQCPQFSQVGFAQATSSLLDKPLSGPVYIRSSSHDLPDLVADLHGQFHIVLVGRTDQVHARIRTTFDGLPDVPVSTFKLKLFGAKKGILENGNFNDLCEAPQRAMVRLYGQNGRSTKRYTRINTVPCKRSAQHRRHDRHLRVRPPHRAGRTR